MSDLFLRLFPSLVEDRWTAISLDLEARSWASEEEYPTNPLLDPLTCSEFVADVTRQKKCQHTFGGYLEDRSYLWRGHYMKPSEMIHLGIDFNVPAGTHVHVPVDCIFTNVERDKDQNGGWGGKLTFYIPAKEMFFVLAHLSHKGLPQKSMIGMPFRHGTPVGIVGQPKDNGYWYPHLHVQCISKEKYQSCKGVYDGYGAALASNPIDYPDPLVVLS